MYTVENQHIHCPLSEMCGLLLPYIVPSHEAWCAVCTHTRVLVFDILVWHKIPQDTFYLHLQHDGAMSRVLTESQCSGDEREIEWTIPGIGLSTHFSKFSDKPGEKGWKSFLETRKAFCF